MDKHPYEELAKQLVERIRWRIDIYKEFLSVAGRPVFTQPLSSDEMMAVWTDPAKRLKLEEHTLKTRGDKGLQELRREMMKTQLNQPWMAERMNDGRTT